MNVFSFCLYGPYNARYYPGMIENIQLIQRHFPEWFVFVYVGSDVAPEMVSMLQSAPRVVLRFTGKTGIENMIERFYAIDEPDVDLMVVRDADSRVHSRDRWAIHDFLASPQFVLHTIRDHKEHSASIMGGLWAIRKSSGIDMHAEYEAYKLNPEDRGIALDQNFLSCRIYPRFHGQILAHIGRGPSSRNEAVRAFPTPWTERLYCGQIESPGFIDSEGTIPTFRLKLSR